MTYRIFIALVLAATLSSVAQAQSDRDRIQGMWQVVNVANNGFHLADDRSKCMLVKIDDKRIRIKEASRNFAEVMLYLIDPDKSPKWIDLVCAHDPPDAPRILGIYKFDGDDSLTIVWRRDGGPRPKEFATCPRNPLTLDNILSGKPPATTTAPPLDLTKPLTDLTRDRLQCSALRPVIIDGRTYYHPDPDKTHIHDPLDDPNYYCQACYTDLMMFVLKRVKEQGSRE